MKRYILFKAKKTKSKTWGFGDYWYNGFTQEHYLKCLTEGGTQFEDIKVELSTVCQFTGLLDKNGNKIFEGDLCKDQFNRIMKVVFHNFRLKFECISGGDSDHWKYADFIDWCKYKGAEITHNCRVEIIGNIHD